MIPKRLALGSTHEHTLNVALGEVLDGMRRIWRADAEKTQMLQGQKRPDVLVEDASLWPVVIEAERTNHASAEKDAIAKLGLVVAATGRTIETAIPMVYPVELTHLDGAPLRDALRRTTALEYALYTRRESNDPERLPASGWMRGSVRDLAMLVHRAAVPQTRVDALANDFQTGVEQAAGRFTQRHRYGSETGEAVAKVLRQADDTSGQTRRMAMTVLANALIFQESLAEANFRVQDAGAERRVHQISACADDFGALDKDALSREWDRILQVNYWPIFWSAREILVCMPSATATDALGALWSTASAMVRGGVTRSHDLTGIVFQKLIADRQFLATYYTRPEAAALLAGLALPANRAPRGADWGDGETMAGLQIGDFACGTGTLLSAAYQRLSLLHELHGGDPRKLHGPMMRNGLVGLDVVNIAVHLTAAMLAGSHPDTPFDGECLLTMPYGDLYRRKDARGRTRRGARVGSLDLLAENVQAGLLDKAAAVTSGGRAPEEVRDLVSRVGHSKFDLVIMNPPFTRSGGTEGESLGVGNAAFAAFQSSRTLQKRMQESLVALRGPKPIASGNAGLAADFLALALRKVRPDGTIAMVLPLSAVSGIEWGKARRFLAEHCASVMVVTIAGSGAYSTSFSADTGMAECLLIARTGIPADEPRATFVVLKQQVRSAHEAELLGAEISRIVSSGELCAIESHGHPMEIRLGARVHGIMAEAPLASDGGWPLVGIADGELAQAAWYLERGSLLQTGLPNAVPLELHIVRIRDVAGRGPFNLDIYQDTPTGPRGPFLLRKLEPGKAPTYPMLWKHDAKRERRLMVAPDAEGAIKPDMDTKAAAIWATASNVHYNRMFRFNSQSLLVAYTECRAVGVNAWPSVVFKAHQHQYVFALWSNSTLGLLLHWWTCNKTQPGRGITTVTAIPNIPTLDTRVLTEEQHAAAKAAFDALRERRFLPFNQIDEDPARAELDRRLLVDVLGLPESLCEPGGPLDLLRRKLAAEPQIHGGKKSKVVFEEHRNLQGGITVQERSVPVRLRQ